MRSYKSMRLLILFLTALPMLSAADLTIAAASDLAPLEAALKQAFGPGLRFSFASSGSLLQQLENGAPFDVFLSANEQYVKDGLAKNVLAGPLLVYAVGRIALWSKSGETKNLSQLTESRVRQVAIANPAYAPYGAAAKQALESAGVWEAVQPKIVYAENIRQTLQYAESGNVDAAIVSWSLVHNRGGVLLPDTSVKQAGAVVKSSVHRSDAERFLKWLLGPDGQRVLRSHGLFPPK
jgi:molybdate transport system substrate-binding protein